MNRCSWCNRILWPFQKRSPGRTMHDRCHFYVERIAAETQRQYDVDRYQRRMQLEDEL